jgi:hypothetical protein
LACGLVLMRAPGTAHTRRRFRRAWRRPLFYYKPQHQLPHLQLLLKESDWLQVSIAALLLAMSDIPVRPPAPAAPLIPGWTEHKAPSGSYSSHCVICIANRVQATPTTTMPRRRSRHTRDPRQTFLITTNQRRPLHLLPTMPPRITACHWRNMPPTPSHQYRT